MPSEWRAPRTCSVGWVASPREGQHQLRQEVKLRTLAGVPLDGVGSGEPRGLLRREKYDHQDILEHSPWLQREKCIRGARVGSGRPVRRLEQGRQAREDLP